MRFKQLWRKQRGSATSSRRSLHFELHQTSVGDKKNLISYGTLTSTYSGVLFLFAPARCSKWTIVRRIAVPPNSDLELLKKNEKTRLNDGFLPVVQVSSWSASCATKHFGHEIDGMATTQCAMNRVLTVACTACALGSD